MWETLLPVVVGGSIGLVGSVVGSPLTHWLSQRKERRNKRAEKFEELVRFLHQHHHWLYQLRNAKCFGVETGDELRPFPSAQAIADVYFPDYSAKLMQLDTKSMEYELCLTKAASKRVNEPGSDFLEGTADSYSEYLKPFMLLNQELRTSASRLIR